MGHLFLVHMVLSVFCHKNQWYKKSRIHFQEDFRVAMDTLKPNVDIIIRACELLMESESLKAFLRYVLHTGNFINAVRFRFIIFFLSFFVSPDVIPSIVFGVSVSQSCCSLAKGPDPLQTQSDNPISCHAGNQWSRPMKSKDVRFPWSASLVFCIN